MLQEIETKPFQILKEYTSSLRCDTAILGSGITGLLLAKKLTDLGQSVVLLDSNPTLAYGASIKNHGWLHRGTVHAVSVSDKIQAKKVVQKLIYGHEFIKSYAGECIEDPFEPVYITTQNGELAHRAVELWSEFGVEYEEIAKDDFFQIDPYISQFPSTYFFKSSDLRINNRILFQKLVADIRRKNGIIINNVDYNHAEKQALQVKTEGREVQVEAGAFVYCTGALLEETYRKLTGQSLDISYWKSHLLYLPRFNPFSVVSLDRGGPIIINHRDMSVINRGYDEVLCEGLDYSTDFSQVLMSFESLRRMYSQVETLKEEMRYVACIKPSMQLSGKERHSVDSQTFEPLPGHFFVLPGKMTEAPYIVDELIHTLYGDLDFSEVTPRPIDDFINQQKIITSTDFAQPAV